jgi:transposase
MIKIPPFTLTSAQWALLQPLLPPPSPFLRGRPPLDDCLILSAVLWKLASGSPWYDLPASYPSHQTCYRRYRLWYRLGLFDPVLRALVRDLSERGGLDLRAAIKKNLGSFPAESPSLDFDPGLDGTWQLETARLLLALTFTALGSARRRSRRRKTYLPSI